MTEPEVLTVPVVNVNYLPEGIVALEGVVPNTPVDDPLLSEIKTNYEDAGLVSGDDAAALNPPPEEPEPEPEPPADEESPATPVP